MQTVQCSCAGPPRARRHLRHRVYKGGSIVLSPLILHRHPAYWDRLDEFLPDRWLDAEAEKRRPRFAWIPSSAGPRHCIGNIFSMMEAVRILAPLAQRFDAVLSDGRRPKAEYLVLARPRGDVAMPLRNRRAIQIEVAPQSAR